MHCVKIVHIRSYSGPYFPAFGLNKKRYGVSAIVKFIIFVKYILLICTEKILVVWEKG